MTRTGGRARTRPVSRFFFDARGRDIGLWGFTGLGSLILLIDVEGSTRHGWVLVVVFAVQVAGFINAAYRLTKHRNVPAPDECAACGHTWKDHAHDDESDVCGGCAHEIEFGVAPRVAGGCRAASTGRTA